MSAPAVDLAAVRERCERQWDAEHCYGTFKERGFDYGPRFQSIEALWLGDGEALGRLAPTARADDPDLVVDPVVLDAVGGEIGEQSLGCLAPFGRLVVYGVPSKQLAPFAGSQLMREDQSVIGYWLTGRLHRTPPGGTPVPDVMRSLVESAHSGHLRAVVRQAFPLEAAADAHRAVSDRRTVGKVVLTT